MEKQWIGCAPDNFRKGRPAGLKPDTIVLHTLDGSLADADIRYHRPGILVSVHYAVGRKGEINQYVDEADTAYHAGLIVNPSATLVKSRLNTNPNFYTIGIALEGKAGEPITEIQVGAASALIREIADRWNILLDANHVVSHEAIRSSLPCPGPTVDIQHLIDNAVPNDPVRTIAGKEVVSLSNVNVRSKPSLAAPILRVLAAGTRISVTGFVTGETAKGNSWWYQNEQGNFFWAGATDHPHPRTLTTDTDASTDTMRLPTGSALAAGMAVNRSRFRLPRGQFISERHPKDLVVLHFTAGTTAQSAFDTWLNNDERVAAAYVVDTDGSIYELFDPAHWAFHLGVRGTDGAHDKRSIAIEIVNVGPLKLSASHPDTLNWWPENFKTAYCKLAETDKYVRQSYRDIEYFATFPDKQIVSVRELVNDLCARFAIPKHLPPADKQFERDLGYFANYKGIACHSNFRQGKWDIGPGFKWPVLGVSNLI